MDVSDELNKQEECSTGGPKITVAAEITSREQHNFFIETDESGEIECPIDYVSCLMEPIRANTEMIIDGEGSLSSPEPEQLVIVLDGFESESFNKDLSSEAPQEKVQESGSINLGSGGLPPLDSVVSPCMVNQSDCNFIAVMEHNYSAAHICTICGQQFKTTYDLISHYETVPGDILMGSDICMESFIKTRPHANHLRRTAHDEERRFACDTCEKRFKRKFDLVVHMRTHTGESPFSCPLCGKDFKQKWNLVVHQRTHTGERPHGCYVCGRAFGLRSTLLSHIRTHTNERPFECELCHKAFGLRSTLRAHIRIHTLERPYVCDTCGKTFGHRAALRSHKGVHSADRPFQCDTCGKAFRLRSTLRVHMRVH